MDFVPGKTYDLVNETQAFHAQITFMLNACDRMTALVCGNDILALTFAQIILKYYRIFTDYLNKEAEEDMFYCMLKAAGIKPHNNTFATYGGTVHRIVHNDCFMPAVRKMMEDRGPLWRLKDPDRYLAAES